MCVRVSIVIVTFIFVYVVCSGAEERHLQSIGVETINQSINCAEEIRVCRWLFKLHLIFKRHLYMLHIKFHGWT